MSVRCLHCKIELSDLLEKVCPECGHFQDASPINIGEKVIYDPSETEINDIWAGYELEGFYPGMLMLVREVISQPLKHEVFIATVNETGKYNLHAPSDLCSPRHVKKERQQAIIERFRSVWQKKKFNFLSLRKGQKVIFRPSRLTRMWDRTNPEFKKLKAGEAYTIKETVENRFVLLDDVPFMVYWKDVEKIA